MNCRCRFVLGLTTAILAVAAARAASPLPRPFRPDSASVQRYGRAYRYPQAGWIVLHIEGTPYERGYQHGRLMAPEIVGYLRCFAAMRSAKSPPEGWKNTRSLVNSLFLRRYDREYLEEMKGIADGATAVGARFEDRPLDLVDIVGINSWAEIETLDSALEATATGLEGVRFPNGQPRAMPEPKPMHCSAFAATGPATADGKIVFGHITMFGLYPSLFYNVWLDIKPARGHRVVMQTYPGGIQSGMDYYLNDAGLLVCETTIAQTRYDIQGMALGSRIRQVLQYADGIDRAVEILRTSNNGLYTNEWLLGDNKTNEIALFELGTRKTRLYRSGRHEWFGGTEGFYWGCNNAKDLDVRLETIPGVNDRPANVVWHPSDRDIAWQRLYAEHRGRIDLGFGQKAFTTPPIAAFPSVDAKVTNTELSRRLQTAALFGPPLGRTWQPTPEERAQYPEIRPLVSHPWTLLATDPPPAAEATNAVDLPERIHAKASEKPEEEPATESAWFGTLLPRTDRDVWLTAAFSDYERIVARENALKKERSGAGLSSADRERLGLDLFDYRARYQTGARSGGDLPLDQVQAQTTTDTWYRLADGKGVLILNELRQVMGDEAFTRLMESFGREHAGRDVEAAQFEERAREAAGRDLKPFFDAWVRRPGLPALRLEDVSLAPAPRPGGERGAAARTEGYRVEGAITRDGDGPPARVEVTVDFKGGEVSRDLMVGPGRTHFSITLKEMPFRVTVDKYGRTVKANGGPFSVLSFASQLPETIIVYGTQDEAASHREAAEELQKTLRRRWSNHTVPVLADSEVADHALASHHVLLIGRPDSNRCLKRFQAAFPMSFGNRSFQVCGDTYAHPQSAIVAAAENPLNRRFSLVALSGLSAESTLSVVEALGGRNLRGDVVILAHDERPRARIVPPRELVHEFPGR